MSGRRAFEGPPLFRIGEQPAKLVGLEDLQRLVRAARVARTALFVADKPLIAKTLSAALEPFESV